MYSRHSQPSPFNHSPLDATGQRPAPHPARRVQGRRRGQALLLAVLLMVFAALLGSTFMVIVSPDLSHTARQGEQSTSRQAAHSGIAFVSSK